jgi:predicted ATP-dependent endonuclease of OLD family
MFHRRGFNLCGDIDVSFEGKGKFNISIKDNYPIKFFDNLANIQCIVGKNGQGKSTILQALIGIQSQDKDIDLDNSFILIELDQKYYILGDVDFKRIFFYENNISKDVYIWDKVIPTVLYSPVYSPEKLINKVNLPSDGFVNVSNDFKENSLSSLEEEEDLRSQFELFDKYSKTLFDESDNHIKRFFKLEINHVKRDVAAGHINKLINLWIDSRSTDVNRDKIIKILERSSFLNELLYVSESSTVKTLRDISAKLSRLIVNSYTSEKNLAFEMKNQYVLKLLFELDSSTTLYERIYLWEMHFTGDLDFQIVKNKEDEKLRSAKDFFMNRLIKFRECSRNIEKVIKSYNVKNVYPLKFSDKDTRAALEIKKIIDSIPHGSGLFSIKWSGISTGEFAKINLFSRLNIAKKKLDSHAGDSNYLLILLDEPDIFLHPEWQRLLISDLCKKLPILLNSTMVIQVVMTTHSPVVLTDLPKSNVIFLRDQKIDDTESKRVEIHRTFGANIHDLYWNGFFTSHTTGEHCKAHIENVISLIKKKKIDQSEREYCENIIEMIGDDMLRKALKSSYYDRHCPDDKRVDILKQKIEELSNELAGIERR